MNEITISFIMRAFAVCAVAAALKAAVFHSHLTETSDVAWTTVLEIWGVAMLLTFAVFQVSIYMIISERKRFAPANNDPEAFCHVKILERFAVIWDLSDSERDVAMFAAKGFSNAEIAKFRGSAVTTVKAQLGSIFRKSGLGNRVQLIALVSEEVCEEAQELVASARHPRQMAFVRAKE